MNITNIKYFCTTNGDGFRTAVFVAGCNIHCKGCFNSAAWSFDAGQPLTPELICDILDSIEPTYIEGLSILGGEPMDQQNQRGVYELINSCRKRFGLTKTIWLWTGYTKESIPHTQYTDLILGATDILVDGPYVDDLSDIKLRYRGSSNQRIIELNKQT